MITTILLGILGVLLAIVLVLMVRAPSNKKAVAAAASAPELAAGAGIELFNARVGDVVSIHAAADDFSDVDFTVDRRNAYQTGSRRWIELGGDFRGNRVSIEVQPPPERQVTGFTNSRRLTLADLQISEEQLVRMDERQDPSAFIQFDGKRWQYQSSRELGYFENEQGEGAGLYRWMFTEQSGTGLLSIDKREGDPFDVRIARQFSTQDISVYRAA